MSTRLTPRRRALAAGIGALALAALVAGVVVPHGRAGGAARQGERSPLTNLPCGAVIVASVTLTNNLTNCGNPGLTIQAAHPVTLNLNGHTVSGQGVGTGIDVRSSGATVINGTVTHFAAGVRALDASAVKIQSLRIFNAADGIQLIGTGSHDVVTGNLVFGNTHAGVFAVSSVTALQVTNNAIRSNTVAGIDSEATGVIAGNKLVSNGDGMRVTFPGSAVISGNTANSNSGTGILVDGDASTIGGNTASFNTDLGIDAGTGGDADAGGNRATGNGNLHQCANIVCS